MKKNISCTRNFRKFLLNKLQPTSLNNSFNTALQINRLDGLCHAQLKLLRVRVACKLKMMYAKSIHNTWHSVRLVTAHSYLHSKQS